MAGYDSAATITQCRAEAAHVEARRGEEPDFTRCDERLASRYTRIEHKFGEACAALGDFGSIQSDAIGFADGVRTSTRGELFCPEDPTRIITTSTNPRPIPAAFTNLGGGVLQLTDSIYMAPGFGNTFLVVTAEGNVVIDTSLSLFAPAHENALRAIDAGPVKYIILTHAHADHTGGVGRWKDPGAEVIAHHPWADLP